jgi:hypothetical protein
MGRVKTAEDTLRGLDFADAKEAFLDHYAFSPPDPRYDFDAK